MIPIHVQAWGGLRYTFRHPMRPPLRISSAGACFERIHGESFQAPALNLRFPTELRIVPVGLQLIGALWELLSPQLEDKLVSAYGTMCSSIFSIPPMADAPTPTKK